MTLDLDIPAGNLDLEFSQNLFDEFGDFFKYFQGMPQSVKTKIGISDTNYHKFFTKFINNPNKSLYRRTESSDDYLVDDWLSDVAGQASFLESFIRNDYVPIEKSFLSELYLKHINDIRVEEIQTTLISKGIYLIFHPALSGAKVDGAAFKIGKNPVIGLSLRLNQLDSFWFTLLHELAHIVLHYSSLETPIADYFTDEDDQQVDLKENQANRLARDTLIPKSMMRTINTTRNEAELFNYATLYNIHPAIIAGRISFERKDWITYSKLRNNYKVERP